jgi:peroxin-5
MMKGLMENECAGQNPLMKLTQHFSVVPDGNTSSVLEQHQAMRNMQIHNSNIKQPEHEQLVSEYLAIEAASGNQQFVRRLPAPRSFQMEALFNELKSMDQKSGKFSSNSISTSALNTTTKGAGVGLNEQYHDNNFASILSKSCSPAAASVAAAPSTIRSISQVNNLAPEWSQEYWSSLSAAFKKQQTNVAAVPNNLINDKSAFKWSTDYLTQTEATILDEAWENMLTSKNASAKINNNASTSNLLANGLNSNNQNLIATNQLNEEMRKTANDLLDSMQDSPFSETEFVQFVRNLSVNGKLNNVEAMTGAANMDKKLVEDYLREENESVKFDLASGDDSELSSEWVKEFEKLDPSETTAANSNMDSYWSDLQDEWNSAAVSNPNHPWLDEFQKVFDAYKIYEFDRENPLKSHPNPFAEGLERLKLHDIVNAVLLFEAAVASEPDNMLAWQYLGTTQVENEQDSQAIRALRRCLELKGDNLVALSTLATSYTNESMQRLAFDSLIKWIKFHPSYKHLLKNDEQAARLLASSELLNENSATPFYMATLSVVHARDFIDLQEIFLKAVRESASTPNKIDPNLQCCLGILFHLSCEYDKAADCFKTALQIKPNDHLLWNKLGATYANNNRNEEAIDAYYQALKLCPGFVRARYNLGIGCMNLGAYKEAVEHFLTALLQQSQSTLTNTKTADEMKTNQLPLNNLNNIQKMSETIWSTLRLALSYMDRSDLYSYCLSKDLEYLKNEFKI